MLFIYWGRGLHNGAFIPDVHFCVMDSSTALERANAFCAEGSYGKAGQLLAELVGQHPGDDTILHALGEVFLKTNREADAAGCFERVVQLAPTRPEGHKSLADVYASLGKTGQAKQGYQKAIELGQGYFQAHANLANLLLASDDIDGAIDHFKRAISLRPDIAELHDSLGRALSAGGQSNIARAAHHHALELKPKLATAYCGLGGISVADGHVSEAVGHFRKAISLSPQLIAAHLGLAEALILVGDTADARQILQTLEGRLGDGGRVCSELEYELQRLDSCLASAENDHDRALAILQQLDRSLVDSDKKRQGLYYQLAELCELTGCYSQAYEHACKANALSRHSFDHAGFHREVDEQLSRYSVAEWGRRSKGSNGSASPLFILGMPRAGKSLVEKLLASHPRVAALDEKLAFGDLLELRKLEYPGISSAELESALTAESLDAIARDFVDIAGEFLADAGHGADDGIRYVVSTSPGNVWRLGLIRRVFPRARIIHVRRDPLDTCCACFFKHFASPRHAYANDLKGLGFYYRQYQRMMSHWRDALGIPMLEIDYEEMVSDPVGMYQKLLAYLGLDAGDDGVKPIDARMFTSAYVGRWKHYRSEFDSLVEQFADFYRPSLKADAVG